MTRCRVFLKIPYTRIQNDQSVGWFQIIFPVLRVCAVKFGRNMQVTVGFLRDHEKKKNVFGNNGGDLQ